MHTPLKCSYITLSGIVHHIIITVTITYYHCNHQHVKQLPLPLFVNKCTQLQLQLSLVPPKIQTIPLELLFFFRKMSLFQKSKAYASFLNLAVTCNTSQFNKLTDYPQYTFSLIMLK